MLNNINIPIDKMNKQLELERTMSALGVDRYLKGAESLRDNGRETEVLHLQRMIRRYLGPMTTSYNEWLSEQNSETFRGNRKSLFKLVGDKLNAEVIASITLGILIDSVSRTEDNRIMDITVYMKIADRVEDAMRQKKFESEREKEIVWFQKRLNSRGSGSYEVARSEMIKEMSTLDIEWNEWSKSNKMQIGAQLIDICVSRGMPNMFDITKENISQSNSPFFITATKDAVEWIADFRDVTSLLSPALGPCVVPPKPWTDPLSGGYYSDTIQNSYNLIKRSSSKKTKAVCKNHDMSRIFSSLNTLQDTAWVINREILEISQACYKGVLEVPKFPPFKAADRKPRPILSTDVFKEMSDKEQKIYQTWLVEIGEYFKDRASNSSKTNLVNRIIGEAKKYESDDEIFYVYNVDYRGRIYPIASFLSPQGNDLSKALLQFKDGKKLGSKCAANWLAIHGANVFGNDKISLADRIKWIDNNVHDIVASARDPYNHSFWTKADKPFQFLSFCKEWELYQEQGLDFESRIAVAMDGSCSGIQHYSALYKDVIGAKAVNLLDADIPSDIYGEVAKVVISKIQADMKLGNNLGKPCLDIDIVNRTMCKRSVMTLPYGVSQSSSTEYVKKFIKEQFVKKQSKYISDIDEISNYVGKLVWTSITDVVFTPVDGKKWLQSLSKVLSDQNKPIKWTTPIGMPVVQSRFQSKKDRVHILVDNNLRLASFSKETKKIDKRGQSNSIAPNYIHSMDSAHLMLTVNKAEAEGITNFAMIHDSFGTHAADSPRFAAILRETFSDMYKSDLLEEFYNQIQEQSDKKIPKKISVPTPGDLDINEVLNAKYFFA